ELARTFRGKFKAVAQDPFYAVASEKTGLFRSLVGRAYVNAAAETRVLALGIFADAHHVDVGAAAVGERRREAGEEPHRPQVDVLLKTLAQRKQQVPDRDVIWNRW